MLLPYWMHEDRRIYQTNDVVYDGDGPQNVEVEVRYNMEINKLYTAVINVTTVKSTTTEFIFSKHLIIILLLR